MTRCDRDIIIEVIDNGQIKLIGEGEEKCRPMMTQAKEMVLKKGYLVGGIKLRF